MTAIIIEDDKAQAEFVREALERHGYMCTCVADGEEGYFNLKAGDYGLALVDIMLPTMSGLEVIRRIREDGKRLPIIVLSQLTEVADRVSGLERGADDYLCKPFSMDELIARIQAVKRRLTPARGESLLVYEDLVVDPVRQAATRAGNPIELTPYEYAILEYMLRNVGRTISAATILERVWDMHATMNKNLVAVRMHKLRHALCAFGGRDLITTKRGLGYVLV